MPSLEHVQVSNKHGRVMRIPSFLPNSDEFSLPSAPSITKSGSLDSELSVSPKRNSISRTQKDKGPFHILSSASQTKIPEGQSQAPSSTSTSTRLFGLSKPKEKKEKKKKSKGSRAQPGGELSVGGEGLKKTHSSGVQQSSWLLPTKPTCQEYLFRD